LSHSRKKKKEKKIRFDVWSIVRIPPFGKIAASVGREKKNDYWAPGRWSVPQPAKNLWRANKYKPSNKKVGQARSGKQGHRFRGGTREKKREAACLAKRNITRKGRVRARPKEKKKKEV